MVSLKLGHLASLLVVTLLVSVIVLGLLLATGSNSLRQVQPSATETTQHTTSAKGSTQYTTSRSISTQSSSISSQKSVIRFNITQEANEQILNTTKSLPLPPNYTHVPLCNGSQASQIGRLRIAVIEPVFTASAYSSYGFYSAYHLLYQNYSDLGSRKIAMSELNVSVTNGWGWSWQMPYFLGSNAARQCGLIVGNNTQILTDIDVSNGRLFYSNGTSRFDVVTVMFDEYVTLAEYSSYQQFVSSGGHVIMLDAADFLAQVSYSKSTNTVALVDGHGWEFNGTAVRPSVFDKWAINDTNWFGSNYCCFRGPPYRGAGLTVNNSLAIAIKQEFGPIVFKTYYSHEENAITNFTDTSIIANFIKSKPDNITVAAYIHQYQSGNIIHIGIFSDDTFYHDQSMQYFYIQSILFAANSSSLAISSTSVSSTSASSTSTCCTGTLGKGGYAVLATVGVGSTPIGVTLDGANGNVYITNFNSQTVSEISSKNGNVTTLNATFSNPNGIVFDPANAEIYVVNFGNDTVSVINGTTNEILGSAISVGSGPLFDAYDPANRNIYVTNFASNTLSEIDGNSGVVTTIDGFNGPAGIAFDPTNGDLYVTNQANGTVSVIDGITNDIIGPPITVGTTPDAVAFDSANGGIYVANFFSNTLSIIDSQTNAVTTLALNFDGPQGLAFDASHGNMFVTNANSGTVSAVDSTNNLVASIGVGNAPFGVAFDSANSYMYVANEGDSSVSLIAS